MAKSKVRSKEEIKALFKDGMTIMIGGFMTNGTPETLVDLIVESGVKDLTAICNDGGFPDKGIGKLIRNEQVAHLITSHVGLNPTVVTLFNAEKMKLTLVPMGSLVEKIRSAGAGLGGFLTPTGVGTMAQDGKQTIELDGKTYILETPLKADIAIIQANRTDETGNVCYKGSTRNFNPIMATAADVVIAETEQLVPAGAIGAENVVTPGIFVNYILEGGKR